ncbi:putative reverse transcriptase domain-containing protein [Tanacetum coccineum]
MSRGENQESAFQLLKQKLCEAPILALPEGNDDLVIYCDASHQGLGAVESAIVENRNIPGKENVLGRRREESSEAEWGGHKETHTPLSPTELGH